MGTLYENLCELPVLGHWTPGAQEPVLDGQAVAQALARIDTALYVVLKDGQLAVGLGGTAVLGDRADGQGYPLIGYTAPCDPGSLGDSSFCAAHGLRYPYVAGAMANGIASERLVIALGRAGLLGVFGAAGLPVSRVEAAIDTITGELGDGPFGFNLIHSPNEPDLEAAVVDLYLRRGISLIEASAYLRLTLPVVRYRLHGIHRDASGAVVVPNRIMAKVSRVEVASKFLAPPPEELIGKLLETGGITPEQAEMAREIPMAQDITAEADSGGHTDKRPAIALFPTLCALRDRMQDEYGYARPPRVGLAGGIATPASAAAAFAMGAAYVMTGSINQACIESGASDDVRGMLAETGQADVAMAPAADMFEMGVTVQVLKRGTMFSMRASKLYDLYRSCSGLDDIPQAERAKLEKTVFRAPLEHIWNETAAFFRERDPRQLKQAEDNPKHKMALVFRWYLGQASTWANQGLADRKMDYQIWCGPAMGAFNEWVKGSFLEGPENRQAVTVAHNILYGAAVMARVAALRSQGVEVPPEAGRVVPLDAESVAGRLDTRPAAVESAT